MAGKIIGIDLGTTNSCVAVLDGDEPHVIHNQEGGRTTPSMVSWTADGDVLVGAPSKRQMITNPERTVFGAKRLIGRKADDPEMVELTKNSPFKIAPSPNGDAWVEIDGKLRSPQEISANILKKMRDVAQEFLGEEVEEAIITVPAYFDDVQRQATKDAGAIAGLEVRNINNEPTAAALAYGAGKGDKRLVVFDLGGGTFDVSLLAIESGVFEVLATSGDTRLGGDDFDRVLIDLLADEFLAENDVDLRAEAVCLQRLKEAAERAKIELSSAMTTDINLPFIAAGPTGPVHLMREISRNEFESLVGPLLERLDGPCHAALEAAHMKAGDVDEVLLVGGMSRIPAVQERVVEIFGKGASKGVNPDEIVAMGAAVQSGIVAGEIEEAILLDVTPHPLGLRTAGDKMSVVIESNTTIPHRANKTFATTEDRQTHVSIDVYQGFSEVASRNRALGRFNLGGLPERPKGKVRVQVSLSIDANGILEVEATELSTGKAANVTIETTSGLAPEELQGLISSSLG